MLGIKLALHIDVNNICKISIFHKDPKEKSH